MKSAYLTLYSTIAKCYEELHDSDHAKRNYELPELYKGAPSDKGPFYHRTKADLKIGDLLSLCYEAQLMLLYLLISSKIISRNIALNMGNK